MEESTDYFQRGNENTAGEQILDTSAFTTWLGRVHCMYEYGVFGAGRRSIFERVIKIPGI